jgi:arylsulfatase
MPLRDVHHIREARRGEKARNVQVYDEETRRQIDRMITDRAVDYIAANARSERPYFLFVPFAFAHHPVLAHPDFQGQSVAGEFGDSLVEHDRNVGRILDALAEAGAADNTVVVWASDNGPSPLPTVTPWWTTGDAGPWREEIGTVLEGNVRTPCVIRWQGKILAGHTSNQIVAVVDFFPTLARIAGGKTPADRPMDGVDQLDFFMGRQDKSNREHVLLFLGQKLMAVKWRNYKMHLDGIERVDGVFEDWSFPRAFNLAADPKERWNIWQNTWIGDEIGKLIAAYGASVKAFPNLSGGQPNDQPPDYGVENDAAETGVEHVERNLDAIH